MIDKDTQEKIHKNNYKKKVYSRAINTYGTTAQVIMVFEEMAELQKELSKHLRGKENRTEIAEEIADVEIMLEQMKLIYDTEDEVEKVKKHKIQRLAERLNKLEE
jgi:ubiquinone biosynthesis protein UbiJ